MNNNSTKIAVGLIGGAALLMLSSCQTKADKTASHTMVEPMSVATSSAAEIQPLYKADEKSLAKHYAAPDWFRDAKLGIYFHWGPYTVAEKQNEWYARWMHFGVDEAEWEGKKRGYHHDLLDWHTEKFGHPSEFGYHDLIGKFTGEKFDAAEWAQLFEDSGARFAGPAAMHHDGYAMWDSDVTPWNVADTGPMKDVLGELAAELRKRDMKVVATFHHARHLQRYAGMNLQEATSRYGHLDSYHMFWNSHYPWIEGLATASEDPKLRLLYGNLPEEQWLEEFWLGSLKEVIDNYQPDLIWFDTWLDLIPEDTRYKFAAHYLNSAQEWGKDVVITHKDIDLPTTISVEDFEQGRRDKLTVAPWLTDDTISLTSWSYIEDLPVKTSARVVHDLIDIVSKNGQLLLNVSPRCDGTIPDNQRAVLKDLGDWLKVNGEAIYETRPWSIFGEGPTQMKGDGHGTEAVAYTEKDIRFTTRGNQIYAIALGTPREELTIVALATNNSLDEPPVTSVTALNGDYVESWQQEHDGLKITLNPQSPEQIAYAFKIGQ